MEEYSKNNYLNLGVCEESNILKDDDSCKRDKSICIYSFNSRGFSEEKQDLCKILMIESTNHIPILCNQENFLLCLKKFFYLIEIFLNIHEFYMHLQKLRFADVNIHEKLYL